jgi:hypothetical protein
MEKKTNPRQQTSSTEEAPIRVALPQDLQPDYPTGQEFVIAAGHLYRYLRGEGDHSFDSLVKAGCICLFYAASFTQVEGPRLMSAAQMNTVNEKAAVLERAIEAAQSGDGALRAAGGFLSFNWKDLARVVLGILGELMNR